MPSKKWCDKNYIKGFELDKDILQKNIPNNEKIYSPNTCIFVSKSENIKEMLSRRDNNYLKGYSNPYANDLKHYENSPTPRNAFKAFCDRRDLNIEDFEEIFADWHISKNGDRRRKYYYFLKNKED